jgi:hypothetical protein
MKLLTAKKAPHHMIVYRIVKILRYIFFFAQFIVVSEKNVFFFCIRRSGVDIKSTQKN